MMNFIELLFLRNRFTNRNRFLSKNRFFWWNRFLWGVDSFQSNSSHREAKGIGIHNSWFWGIDTALITTLLQSESRLFWNRNHHSFGIGITTLLGSESWLFWNRNWHSTTGDRYPPVEKFRQSPIPGKFGCTVWGVTIWKLAFGITIWVVTIWVVTISNFCHKMRVTISTVSNRDRPHI